MGKPAGKKSLNIDAELHRAIKVAAAQRGVEMMDLIGQAWAAYTNASEKQEKDPKIVEISSQDPSTSVILSSEAIQWARLAEIARAIQRETGREMYLSVFLQLRMVARDALRENGRDAEIPELPQHPADAPETKRTGRARGGAAAPVVRGRAGKG